MEQALRIAAMAAIQFMVLAALLGWIPNVESGPWRAVWTVAALVAQMGVYQVFLDLRQRRSSAV